MNKQHRILFVGHHPSSLYWQEAVRIKKEIRKNDRESGCLQETLGSPHSIDVQRSRVGNQVDTM